jgi:hypothetical protein
MIRKKQNSAILARFGTFQCQLERQALELDPLGILIPTKMVLLNNCSKRTMARVLQAADAFQGG